jgi:chromosome segregation ATPase
MGDETNARVAAVTGLANALGSYGRAVSAMLNSTRQSLGRADAEFTLALTRSQAELTAAQHRLADAQRAVAACRQDCGALEAEVAQSRRAVTAAQMKLDTNTRAAQRFQRAAAELRAAARDADAAILQRITPARQSLGEHANRLTGYLRTQGA